MQTHIRLFTPDDYPAAVDVFNASWHYLPTSVVQMRQQDEVIQLHPRARLQRYVVEHDGTIIAFGQYDQPPRFYKASRFHISIFVHPHYQKQGIGSQLYERITEDLRALDVRTIWTKLRDDMSAALRFVEKYKFYEELRVLELCLEDVAAFDPTPFVGLSTKLAAQGIEIKTLKELETDEECYQKLYLLTYEIGEDLPGIEQLTQLSYGEFLRDMQHHAPESYFVAVHEGNYIGVSYMTAHKERYGTTGLTGVKREYRHRGIALLMKIRAIAYAKEQGCATIRTSMVDANRASFAMNERLGFVRLATWIIFDKTFSQVVS